MTVPASFRAFRIHADGGHRAGVETVSLDDLSPGEVVVRAAYSSINYKDALAGTAIGQRREVWERLAGPWKPSRLDAIATRETTLDGLSAIFPGMLAGGSFGRTVVRF